MRKRRKKQQIVEETFPCPHCGEDVLEIAKFCRACGASDDSGWGEEPYDEGDDFEYDEYIQREFPAYGKIRPKHIVVAIIILLICFAILCLQVM